MSTEQVIWVNCGHSPVYRCVLCGAPETPSDYALKKRLDELEERLARLERGA